MYGRPNRSDEYTQEQERRTGRPSLFRRRRMTLKESLLLLILVIALIAVFLLSLELLLAR